MVPILAPDGSLRCTWAGETDAMLEYHDTEWGFPVVDDTRLFEKICLEGFQSGLSWRTILTKRENFRRAFAGFDIATVAEFTATDVTRLLADAGIVRHRGKIEAAIGNARCARELQAEVGTLAAYFWRYRAPENGPATPEQPAEFVSTSPLSVALAKDLRRRGWRFVGPTTCYAFMQAMGLVNDHEPQCVIRAAVAATRPPQP